MTTTNSISKAKVYDEELHARVVEYLRGGVKQAELCRRTGQTSTNISLYINRKVQGSVENIERALREYLQQEEEAAAGKAQAEKYQIDKSYKPTSISEDVYQSIRYAQIARKLVILHGDAGVGKTKGADQYWRDNQKSTIKITVKASKSNMRGVAEALCEEMGLPQTGGSDGMWTSIHAQLQGTNKVIVVDEAQLLKGMPLEELRQIPDGDERHGILGNGVVLIGNSELYQRVKRREITKQAYSRMGLTREYYTRYLTTEDIRLLFPMFNHPETKRELKLLAGVCRGNATNIRMAQNIVELAVNNNDTSYEGLLRAAASTPVGEF